MEKKEKQEKTDNYMLVLMGLFYLYMYGKNVIGAAVLPSIDCFALDITYSSLKL